MANDLAPPLFTFIHLYGTWPTGELPPSPLFACMTDGLPPPKPHLYSPLSTCIAHSRQVDYPTFIHLYLLVWNVAYRPITPTFTHLYPLVWHIAYHRPKVPTLVTFIHLYGITHSLIWLSLY